MIIENQIKQAIDKAHKYGITLTDGTWKGTDCFCPMGCLLWSAGKVRAGLQDIRDNAILASEILDVHVDWVNHFISGFDGISKRTIMFNPKYADAYEMGKEFRDQYHEEIMDNKEKRVGT